MRRVRGGVPADALIKEAKIAAGDELSFEQLYDKYKKKKNDFDIQQQLLLEAPMFIPTQVGYDQQKWGARIESLFPEYLKNKKIENMANGADFLILTLSLIASRITSTSLPRGCKKTHRETGKKSRREETGWLTT